MKKIYQTPDMEIEIFGEEDIVRTSGGDDAGKDIFINDGWTPSL